MNDATPLAPFSRRTLLKTASSGFGYLAFAGLSTWASERSAGPARAQGSALPGQGQAGDLPLHGRWRRRTSTPSTTSRSSRATPANRRQGAGRRRQAARLRPGNSSSTARAASGSRTCFPRSPSMPTRSASSTACTPTCPHHPQAFLHVARGDLPVRPALDGRVDALRPGNREREPPRLHHPQARPRITAGRQNYGSAFLPAIYQGTRIGFNGLPVTKAKVGNIKNPRRSVADQRLQLDLVQSHEPRDCWSTTRCNPASKG